MSEKTEAQKHTEAITAWNRALGHIRKAIWLVEEAKDADMEEVEAAEERAERAARAADVAIQEALEASGRTADGPRMPAYQAGWENWLREAERAFNHHCTWTEDHTLVEEAAEEEGSADGRTISLRLTSTEASVLIDILVEWVDGRDAEDTDDFGIVDGLLDSLIELRHPNAG